MGARPLRRMIEQYLEDPLAEKLLHFPNMEKKYSIAMKDGQLAFIDLDPSAESKKDEALAKKE